MSRQALRKACELIGQAGVARACGNKVRQGHVWKWLNLAKCEVPPAEYVLSIERAMPIDDETGEPSVTRHDLRPDIYPLESAAEQAVRERRDQERRSGADRRAESREETA